MGYLNARRAGTIVGSTVAIAMAVGVAACSRDAQAISPQELQQKYGITDAYASQLSTPDGTLRGTSSR